MNYCKALAPSERGQIGYSSKWSPQLILTFLHIYEFNFSLPKRFNFLLHWYDRRHGRLKLSENFFASSRIEWSRNLDLKFFQCLNTFSSFFSYEKFLWSVLPKTILISFLILWTISVLWTHTESTPFITILLAKIWKLYL